jgi:hypothetical protein
MTVLETALRCAPRGWPVFPCVEKRPLLPHGLLEASTDPGTIRGWFGRWPTANLAGRTGRESRKVVLDVDGSDGFDALHDLEREHGELPATLSTKTPRGGSHFIFDHPGGEVPCSVAAIGPGLDIRADGGYILLPPSEVNGRRYEVDQRVPVAPLPGWLLTLIRQTGGGPRKAADPGDWLQIVSGVEEPGRNVALARLVGHLLRKYVDVDLVAELAHMVNESRFTPPLERKDVDKVIDSISAKELRRRERAA